MGKGVKFQLMRSVKSGKNRWLFISFIVYIISFCVFLGYKEKSYDEAQKSILQYELQQYGDRVKMNSSQLLNMNESEEGYDKLKNENDFYQSQYNSSMLMKTLIDNRIKGSKELTEDSLNFIKDKEMKSNLSLFHTFK